MRLRKQLAWLFLGLPFFLAAVYFFSFWESGPREETLVSIPAGASAREVGELLAAKGVIRYPGVFATYLRFWGLAGELKAGTYAFAPPEKANEVLQKLLKGEVAVTTFTVPEGYNLRQIARLLASKGLVTEEEFWRLVESGEFSYPFLEGAPQGKQRLEGFLFPDTYTVPLGTPPREVIELMLRRFGEVYSMYEARARELGLKPLEVVTLASLVEKETKLPSERPLVAAVFFNRLRQGMPLQSCATIQYLLEEPKEKLTLADLEISSPYNTYLNAGLPPGPIASPGRAALEAVLYPADSPYLYFALQPDGSHAFSETFAEHLKASENL